MGVFHELQKKPSHVKSRYAFLGALVATFSIGVIWATSLPAQFASISDSIKSTSESASVSDGLTDLVSQARVDMATQDEVGTVSEEVPTDTVSSEGVSALGNLQTWDATTTQVAEQPVAEGEAAAGTSTAPAPQVPVVSPPPPTPKIILIGTTTSKKSE